MNDLERILVHESLKIDSEDSLFDSISDFVSRDESYSSLFKYVQFEYLDSAHLDQFFKAVYPEYTDLVLWESIAKFVTNSVKTSPPNMMKNRRLGISRFEYDSSRLAGDTDQHLVNYIHLTLVNHL